MRMLDLFSGIGGFSLAAQWVWGDDLEIIGFCEIEKYAQRVLQKNFPGVHIYEDITKLDGKDFKNVDLITGGFPCQDLSSSGKGAGIDGERSGLWSELHRIIGEVRPRYALIENVPMLIHRGFERVLCDLTSSGYNCEWQIIGADDVDPPAPHRRKRIWIVAYLPDSPSIGLHTKEDQQIVEGEGRGELQPVEPGSDWSDQWTVEPGISRMAHGISHRVDRIKGIGNSICPQVSYEIMKLIKER